MNKKIYIPTGALLVAALLFWMYVAVQRLEGTYLSELTKVREAYQKEKTAHEELKKTCATLSNQCKALKELKERQNASLYSYITSKYKTVPKMVAQEIANQTVKLTHKHSVPFSVVVGIMEVESGFNPTAVSKKGARGLMQVMPSVWAKKLGLTNGYELHEIDTGIESGIRVYLHYYKAEKAISGTLARYFGDAQAGYQTKVFKAISEFIFHMAENQ